MSVTVDQILQRMIVDAKNYNPTIKISQGTETYIRFAAAASAIWGLYKQMDWTLDQIFPTTMNQESLEQWANDRGLNYNNLTASELLTLILSYLRNPKSGGKPSDYERWALEASSTGTATALAATMITGNMPNLSAANAAKPHDRDGIAFACGTDDVEKNVVIDLGSSKEVFGIGLGFITNRAASFGVFTSDDAQSWTRQGKIDAVYWWAMTDFGAVSARYIKVELEEIESLESWQTESLNEVKSFGIEIYEPSTTDESPSTARCLSNYYGVGTVLMLLGPSSLSMRCCEAVRAKCEYEGPVAPREIWVNVPTEPILSLRVTVQGLQDLNEDSFRKDVVRYFADLEPGGLFIPAQIVVYVLKNGGTNATIEVSQDGGEYREQTSAIASGKTEQFVLGDLVVR